MEMWRNNVKNPQKESKQIKHEIDCALHRNNQRKTNFSQRTPDRTGVGSTRARTMSSPRTSDIRSDEDL
jgi:hypothetical protein